MTKQEVITALEKARDVYAGFINEHSSAVDYFELYKAAYDADLGAGFCNYFQNMPRTIEPDLLIATLNIDRKGNGYIYWYETVETTEYDTKVSDCIASCLQPRLDHLNRTIARLQKEITA